MTLLIDKKILIAGYGLPAEMAISILFSMGVKPEQIQVLTHECDSRNSGVHTLCQLRNLSICCGSAKLSSTWDWVGDFAPDIILSIHYRNIIPKQLLDKARLGGVNLHPSLLPLYKGAHSVSWSLINGDEYTGYSYHYMDETLDTGKIIYQEKIAIDPMDTSFSLFHKQILTALPKLPLILDKILAGEKGESQISEGSYYSRTLPFNGKINTDWSIDKIKRFINAMYFPPFTPAIVEFEGRYVEINTFAEYKKLFCN